MGGGSVRETSLAGLAFGDATEASVTGVELLDGREQLTCPVVRGLRCRNIQIHLEEFQMAERPEDVAVPRV